MCFVPPDGGFTGEIESWEDLRGRKVNFIPWPDYYPGFSLLLDLWKENSDLEVIRQYFEQYKQTSLDRDKAGLLLDKSCYFNRCTAIEDIYRLLG